MQSSTAALFLATSLAMPMCHAESLPLWELGAGVGAISLYDYRGSDERQVYVLPVSYLVYRGEFLRADRNGLRGTLFSSDRVEVNVSVNGTIPVNSKDNVARSGMADLRPTIELGPTVDIALWNTADKKIKLDFRAPVRTSITAESSPKQIGWLFSPNLNLRVRDPAGMPGWNLGLGAEMIVNDRKYDQHFYSVSATDSTAARPIYSAPGGYAGSQFTAILSKRFPRYWVGGFVRYDSLAGAVFSDSPLVKKASAVSAGIAVSWVFSESTRRVDAEDRD